MLGSVLRTLTGPQERRPVSECVVPRYLPWSLLATKGSCQEGVKSLKTAVGLLEATNIRQSNRPQSICPAILPENSFL